MPSLLDILRKVTTTRSIASLEIDVAGQLITVELKRNARARRLTLRMARDGRKAQMTLPNRVSRIEAQHFAEKSRDWLAVQLQRQDQNKNLLNQSQVALRGDVHHIEYTGSTRGLIKLATETMTIHVPGKTPHTARRLTDWMKQEAKQDLIVASQKYADRMSVSFSNVTVRDQRSRWGSCSTSGALSYSWRLIMAPPYVLDYVAAHEVAHLKEMNHSRRFWRLVLEHCPETRKAKQWLKQNGASLHRVY